MGSSTEPWKLEHETWIQGPTLLLTYCVILPKSLNLPVPQFLHL